MALYVMATRLAGGALTSPETLERVEREVMSRVREHKLDVQWLGNYALLGPYDYLDVFEAPSNDVAMQLAALIRTFGHAHTEVWPATQWERFKDLVRELPADASYEACGWSR
jgi:uncharacterized protein with GYD domain